MYTDKEFIQEAVRRGYCPKRFAKDYVKESESAVFDEDDLHRVFLKFEMSQGNIRKTELEYGRTSKDFGYTDEF